MSAWEGGDVFDRLMGIPAVVETMELGVVRTRSPRGTVVGGVCFAVRNGAIGAGVPYLYLKGPTREQYPEFGHMCHPGVDFDLRVNDQRSRPT